MSKGFTKKELSDYFEQNSENGKISFVALGNLVFDSDFPEKDYEKAKDAIISMQKESERFREIPELMQNKLSNAEELMTEINKLEQQGNNTEKVLEEYRKITNEFNDLESEFLTLKAKIADRTKE